MHRCLSFFYLRLCLEIGMPVASFTLLLPVLLRLPSFFFLVLATVAAAHVLKRAPRVIHLHFSTGRRRRRRRSCFIMLLTLMTTATSAIITLVISITPLAGG